MSNEELKRMAFTFNVRSAARSGPTSSDKWNDTIDEIASDLAALQYQWNSRLVGIVGGLPNGSYTTAINAFTLGLDGKNCWVDQNVTSTSSETTYYDAGNDRPYTIKESLDVLHTRISNTIEDLQESFAQYAAALTSDEKAAIGWHIFDNSKTSSSTSLDGKSERNRLNLLQVAQDIYGASYSIDNDGQANLTNSVAAVLDALLELHNGDWNTDLTLDHTGVSVTVAQDSINSSSPGDDTFVAAPTNLEEDLDQIRTEIKDLKGTLTWTTNHTPLYVGGADTLEELLVSTAGTGTKAANNPFGYHFTNLDGLDDAADYITTTATSSGLPTGLPVETVQNVLGWMVNPAAALDYQYFRRMVTGVYGDGPWTVWHGREEYPIVQLVQVDPDVTTSGQYSYTVEHDNTNQFTMTMPPGVALVSGVIVSIW